MGIFNMLMHRQMRNEAKRMAQEISIAYNKTKKENPNLPEQDVIIRIMFDPKPFAEMPEESRKKSSICCETINGLCYMIALDHGRMKDLINMRSIQFTIYMDMELEKQGFPVQSKEQKERILEVMDLKFENWETISV